MSISRFFVKLSKDKRQETIFNESTVDVIVELSERSIENSDRVQNQSEIDYENDPSTSKNKFYDGKMPIRPFLKFPKDNENRSFLTQWYEKYDWLEYSILRDSAYCFHCRHFNLNKDKNSINGFKNWKNAIRAFDNHQNTNLHLTSKQLHNNRLLSKKTVASLVNSQHAKEVEMNRKYMKFLIENVVFLAKQGLALRGHIESVESKNRGNFVELLNLRLQDRPEFLPYYEKNINYASPKSQNEIINSVAHTIRQKILPEKNNFFSIIVDETSDISKIEQLSFCIRYVDENLIIHEHLLGLFPAPSTSGEALFEIVKDVMKKYGLSFDNIVGQSYDGAASMSGKFKGLSARVKQVAPKAVYVHCYAHRLNLAIESACSTINKVRDVINIVQNLYVFIEGSTSRHALFQHLQDEKKQILKSMCNTRWSCRASAFKATILSFDAIVLFLKLVDEDDKTATGATAKGLLNSIQNFEFIIILVILNALFQETNCLNKNLQNPEIDIVQANDLAMIMKIKKMIMKHPGVCFS